MPLRKSDNGGWQRVSRQQMVEEEEQAAAVSLHVSAPTVIEDRDEHGLRAWASEGVRRVREDAVMRKMHYLTAMAALGGFLFGYDTGVISGAMLPIRRHFLLDPWQQEVVVSSTVLSAFFSSLSGGSLNTFLGRRVSILLAAAIFTAGSLCLMMAWSYTSLVFGRIIIGVGIGIASLTTPVYIAEMALPRLRGQLVTVNAFFITGGQFTAGMVDGIFDEVLPNSGWRMMLGLAAVPSIIMLIGFLDLPESPRWLAMKGRVEEATSVLRSLRESDQEADMELQEILGSVAEPGSEPEVDANEDELEYGSGRVVAVREEKHFVRRFIDMVSDAPTRRALILGCGIMMVQQCSGINTGKAMN